MFRHRLLTVLIPLFFGLSLADCAGLQKLVTSVGGLFHTNSDENFENYDLEQRVQYVRYRESRRIQKKEEERRTLERLKQDKAKLKAIR